MENNNQSGTSEKLYRLVDVDYGNLPPERELPYFVIMANFSHGTLWPNDFFKWRVTQYLEGLPPSIQDKDAEIALLEAREVAWSQRVGQLEETIETLSKTYNL